MNQSVRWLVQWDYFPVRTAACRRTTSKVQLTLQHGKYGRYGEAETSNQLMLIRYDRSRRINSDKDINRNRWSSETLETKNLKGLRVTSKTEVNE